MENQTNQPFEVNLIAWTNTIINSRDERCSLNYRLGVTREPALLICPEVRGILEYGTCSAKPETVQDKPG